MGKGLGTKARLQGLEEGKINIALASHIAGNRNGASRSEMEDIIQMLGLTTRLRHQVHDPIHALDGHERSMVPRVSQLPARRPPTLGAPTTKPLLSGEPIG